MKVHANLEIDIESLAYSLDQKDAANIIKIIDKERYDGDFTFEMAAYFIKEVMDFDIDGSYVQALKEILK